METKDSGVSCSRYSIDLSGYRDDDSSYDNSDSHTVSDKEEKNSKSIESNKTEKPVEQSLKQENQKEHEPQVEAGKEPLKENEIKPEHLKPVDNVYEKDSEIDKKTVQESTKTLKTETQNTENVSSITSKRTTLNKSSTHKSELPKTESIKEAILEKNVDKEPDNKPLTSNPEVIAARYSYDQHNIQPDNIFGFIKSLETFNYSALNDLQLSMQRLSLINKPSFKDPKDEHENPVTKENGENKTLKELEALRKVIPKMRTVNDTRKRFLGVLMEMGRLFDNTQNLMELNSRGSCSFEEFVNSPTEISSKLGYLNFEFYQVEKEIYLQSERIRHQAHEFYSGVMRSINKDLETLDLDFLSPSDDMGLKAESENYHRRQQSFLADFDKKLQKQYGNKGEHHHSDKEHSGDHIKAKKEIKNESDSDESFKLKESSHKNSEQKSKEITFEKPTMQKDIFQRLKTKNFSVFDNLNSLDENINVIRTIEDSYVIMIDRFYMDKSMFFDVDPNKKINIKNLDQFVYEFDALMSCCEDSSESYLKTHFDSFLRNLREYKESLKKSESWQLLLCSLFQHFLTIEDNTSESYALVISYIVDQLIKLDSIALTVFLTTLRSVSPVFVPLLCKDILDVLSENKKDCKEMLVEQTRILSFLFNKNERELENFVWQWISFIANSDFTVSLYMHLIYIFLENSKMVLTRLYGNQIEKVIKLLMIRSENLKIRGFKKAFSYLLMEYEEIDE